MASSSVTDTMARPMKASLFPIFWPWSHTSNRISALAFVISLNTGVSTEHSLQGLTAHMVKVSFQPYCAPAPTLVWCFWLGSSTSSTT